MHGFLNVQTKDLFGPISDYVNIIRLGKIKAELFQDKNKNSLWLYVYWSLLSLTQLIRGFPRIVYFALYSRMRAYHVDVIKLKGEMVRQRAFVIET